MPSKGMIDDIFADVGKYVPVGALVEGEEEGEGEQTMKNVIIEHPKEMDIVDDNDNSNSSKNENHTVKGLFKNLIPSFPSKIKMSEAAASTGLAVNESPEQVTKSNAACVFDDDDDEDNEDVKEIFIKNENKIISKSNDRTKERHTEEDEDKYANDGELRRIKDDKNDLMAPIRALLAAQSAKEKAAYLRSEVKASSHNEGSAIL